MDCLEQARFSGLVLGESPGRPPEWISSEEEWHRVEGGFPDDHASVVVHPPNNPKEEMVVVVVGTVNSIQCFC